MTGLEDNEHCDKTSSRGKKKKLLVNNIKKLTGNVSSLYAPLSSPLWDSCADRGDSSTGEATPVETSGAAADRRDLCMMFASNGTL